MEKRPNNNHTTDRSYVGEVEFEDRVYKIMIGISGLISIILALMLLAAGGMGLFALIKFVLA